MGPAEMDEVADMIVAVLTAAKAKPTGNGATSRAHYTLDPEVAAVTARRARDLLSAHPLYPGIALC
jgi:glycine hydroxymethyltransferase